MKIECTPQELKELIRAVSAEETTDSIINLISKAVCEAIKDTKETPVAGTTDVDNSNNTKRFNDFFEAATVHPTGVKFPSGITIPSEDVKKMTLEEAVNDNNIKEICVEMENIDDFNKLLEQFYTTVDKINNFKIKTTLKYTQNREIHH